MLNIGIDAAKTNRFKSWAKYPNSKLLRIFSQEEIDYCLSGAQINPLNGAERFASRFAFKEATFKALNPFLMQNLPFSTLCNLIWIENSPSGQPKIMYKTELNGYLSQKLNFSVSITHTLDTAIVAVIAYNIDKID